MVVAVMCLTETYLDCDTFVESTLQMVFINSALDILDIEYGNSSNLKCIGKNCRCKCQ